MGKTEGCAVFQVIEYLLIIFRLGRIRDKQDNHIGFPDHLVHLA